MALVDFVDSLAPPWAKALTTTAWWNLFRLGAVLVDGILEGVHQGRLAGMPNQVQIPGVPGLGGFEDTRSLDLLGQDLQVVRGLTQTPADYALMLRKAQDPGKLGWGAGGLVVGVLEQLAAVLGPNPPLMRIVNRAGDWWSRHQDGSFTFQRTTGAGLNFTADLDPLKATPNATVAHGWDWDSVANPPAPPGAGDWWLIVYTPVDPPYGVTTDGTGFDMGTGGDLWNDPSPRPLDTSGDAAPTQWQGTGGSNAPYALVEIVRRVIGQRQTVGFMCQDIIVAFDPASFNPDGSSVVTDGSRSPYPDGTWVWNTVFDPATHTVSLTRLQTAIYWRGPSPST